MKRISLTTSVIFFLITVINAQSPRLFTIVPGGYQGNEKSREVIVNDQMLDYLVGISPEKIDFSIGDQSFELMRDHSHPEIPVTFSSGYDIKYNPIKYKSGDASLFVGNSPYFKYKDDQGNHHLITPNQDNQVVEYLQLDVVNRDTNFCGVLDHDLISERSWLDHIESSDLASKKLIKLYVEVDHDIWKDHEDGTLDYINAVYDQLIDHYKAIGINVIIDRIKIWDTPSPYYCEDSKSCLDDFMGETQFDADLGQFLSYQASGGIAWVGTLCLPTNRKLNTSFCSLQSDLDNLPGFSWDVMVTIHELGHNLSSQHTHACNWNGDKTAIDAFAGYTEGSCPKPKNPPYGTFMSYAHFENSLQYEFHPQVEETIKSYVTYASCLEEYEEESDDSKAIVVINFQLDYYPREIVWQIDRTDINHHVIRKEYDKSDANQIVATEVSLDPGDYRLSIFDSYGDGLKSLDTTGWYTLNYKDGSSIVFGTTYAGEHYREFTVKEKQSECEPISIENITSYSGFQDQGDAVVSIDKKHIRVSGNAWKMMPYQYDINPNTVLEFDFKSNKEPEFAAIGLDEDDSPFNGRREFTLYGVQKWGYENYKDYQSGEGWKHHQISIGQYYTGQMNYLFFLADDDRLSGELGDAEFANIIIKEPGCKVVNKSLLSAIPSNTPREYNDEPKLQRFVKDTYGRLRPIEIPLLEETEDYFVGDYPASVHNIRVVKNNKLKWQIPPSVGAIEIRKDRIGMGMFSLKYVLKDEVVTRNFFVK